MRVAHVVTVVLMFASLTLGQNPECRQSWTPQDAPAFCAWDAEPPLPEARTYHAVATFEKYIYTLGGFRFDAASSQVIYYDSVVRSTIDASGHLSAWVAEPSFKSARSGAAAVSASKCLFLNAGSSSTPSALTYYDDTQYARIESDGRLSPWVTSPNRLNTPRSNHSLIVITTKQGTFLNAVAGVTQVGEDTVHLDTIEVAKVNPDCTVGEWKLANYNLKGGRSTPQALAVRNNIVVIGGWGDLDLLDIYNDVQIATPRPDGSPSPWRTSPARLTSGIYGHSTVLVEPEKMSNPSLLLSVGGQPSAGAYANWISYAYVLPDVGVPDAIGVWRISPTGRLPIGRAGLSVAQSHARLYVIGGNDASGQYYRDVNSARFDFGQP